jgi:two-component system cell cycle response regulator DivK
MPKKVLIVEDNELNMKLFHDLLDAQGYETLETRDGLQALALARQHHPDLILMDIQLPEISGLEVTKWVKEDEELSHIPVVAVTAFAMKGDEERIREGGCEAYISKPISVSHFLDTIRRFSRSFPIPCRGLLRLSDLAGPACDAWPGFAPGSNYGIDGLFRLLVSGLPRGQTLSAGAQYSIQRH